LAEVNAQDVGQVGAGELAPDTGFDPRGDVVVIDVAGVPWGQGVDMGVVDPPW
jgi:hypothetical protein